MVADIDENLPMLKAELDWGLSDAWTSAKAAVARAGGRVVGYAKTALSWAKQQATAIGDKANALIAKFGVMKKAKKMVDSFFKVTESPQFKFVFTKILGKAVITWGAAYNFNQGHVEAAYKLLTRPFWYNQLWFFKWIINAQFKKDFMSNSAKSNENFKRAGKACHDSRGTIGLAGKLLSLYPGPSIKSIGVGMGTFA